MAAIRHWFKRDDGREKPTSRTIRINDLEESGEVSASNEIATAKYTIWTFFPKFLFEQFRRYANIFFLSIGLLQQIPDVSPTGRFVTVVPFSIILGLTAIKEIIEDFKRHKADSRVNNATAEVYCYHLSKFVEKTWREILVGDILKVNNEKPFPADIMLLSSSEPSGVCYIETANLDGETNLKIRTAFTSTQEKFIDEEAISHHQGVIDCESPNRMLYEFKGSIHLEGEEKIPLTESTLLLRGAKLKNTPWIHGIVVYSGCETKFMMNSSKPPLKRSSMDVSTNIQIVSLFAILIITSILSAIGAELLKVKGENHNYVRQDHDNFGFNFLTFVILYNNLIPISLLVTLEFVKFFQAFFVNWDSDLYDEESKTFAVARTSNLNEELGLIRYVFSDKTGTLTQNIMEFQCASINGKMYNISNAKSVKEYIKTGKGLHEAMIREFFVHLCICHTVIPEINQSTHEITYNASSPDEEALVKGATLFGFRFVDRTQSSVKVETIDGSDWYEIVDMILFTSQRKRMSVIVKTKTGYKLYIKGADSIIMKRLDQNSRTQPKRKTMEHIKDFAEMGLRTLCLAVRNLSEQEFFDWQKRYKNAKSTLTSDREELISQAEDDIESCLTLIGATGIEDKLQDGVPETIERLLKANINVWMLTGDKQETAINIGRSCKLLSLDKQIAVIETTSLEGTRDSIDEWGKKITPKDKASDQAFSDSYISELVIDGDSLVFALDATLRDAFIALCCRCSSVICCRVSPMQKAEMVELVQKHTNKICLSIGDGANDVAMIQRANVGVGISGKEGLQAANTSDFSIAQFKFLSQLLFVHGAWFNIRNSKVILYSFYKNICLYIIELWFAIYNYWTGQVLFERWTIGLYNMFMTSLPPVAIGLFDQNCSKETRIAYPGLYKSTQSSQYFNLKIFWMWIMDAVYHSVILFWLPMTAFDKGVVWKSGETADYLVLGNTVYTCVVMTVCFKAGLTLDSWNRFCHLAIWGSIAVWIGFLALYSFFWGIGINMGANMAGMIKLVSSSSFFWLSTLLTPPISLALDILVSAFRITWFPSDSDGQRLKENKYVPLLDGSTLMDCVRLNSRTNNRSPAGENIELEQQQPSSYAFSQSEPGQVRQGLKKLSPRWTKLQKRTTPEFEKESL